jgi:hypothetical protein
MADAPRAAAPPPELERRNVSRQLSIPFAEAAHVAVPSVAAVLLLLALWRFWRRPRLSIKARQRMLEDLERALSDAKLPMERITS